MAEQIQYDVIKRRKAREKAWRSANPEKVRASGRRYYHRHKEEIKKRRKPRLEYAREHGSKLMTRVKAWCTNKRKYCTEHSLSFDLTESFLLWLWEQQEGKCAITRMPLELQRGNGRQPNAVSLDRIVPAAGYVQGNVRFVCDIVNIMKSSLTDDELQKWSLRVYQGLTGEANPVVPNLNSFADAIDRLIVELLKLSYFEQSKRDEHAKENPDPDLISKWDDLSRDACEYRSILKNEINKQLETIVATKSYLPLKELRTFRAPKKSAGELIEEMIGNRINVKQRKALIASIQKDLDRME